MQMLRYPTPRKPENKGEMLREVTETTLAEGASDGRYSRLNRLGGTTDGRMEDDAASNMPGGMGSGDPNRGSNEKKVYEQPKNRASAGCVTIETEGIYMLYIESNKLAFSSKAKRKP
jgi:hypothetical protein